MTSDTDDQPESAGPAASGDQLATVESLSAARAAAFNAGRTPIPPKFIVLVVVVFAVLGLGGTLAEHYLGGASLPPVITNVSPVPISTPGATTPTLPSLQSPMASYLGLREFGPTTPSPIDLRDQYGKTWTLDQQKGKVVVLTFYNANCNDICPVLGAEIHRASQLLGPEASRVVFAIVNTDPNNRTTSQHSPALTIPDLTNTSSTYFLSASLSQLDTVWTAYGITVEVGGLASVASHNNVVYFIDPSGRLRSMAVPFARKSPGGVFSLGAQMVDRYAEGLAQTAVSLVK